MSIQKLTATAKESRKTILDLCYRSQTGHIGPALSVIDILTVLYFGVLRVSPKTKHQPNRDRFILSKGHAAAALYATLYARGFIPRESVFTYCRDGGLLGTHPDYNLNFGIELTTGSLGHGLPVGVGMALGLGSRARPDSIGARVFVLVSDAEL
ncbi:MAG: transketolase, partial [Patescibacteria group bacterium]